MKISDDLFYFIIFLVNAVIILVKSRLDNYKKIYNVFIISKN